eukprot:scpid95039/ scgid34984/ rRNA-processing protein UTP23 homolog
MKVKRVKQAKRIIAFYQQNFGLRQPYQILIDGSFAYAALKAKINIIEQLPKYLGGEVQCLTTRCAGIELRLLGSAGNGALQIIKQYDERRCGHTVAKAQPTPDCITSLIGEENRHHYIVATQDMDLRKRLRQIAGVPLLLITHNTIMLEKPAEASMHAADRVVESKLAGSVAEQQFVRRLKAGEEPAASGTTMKRKHRKGPNPMSCLKKKPRLTTMTEAGRASSKAPLEKKKRVRRRRKGVEQATPSGASD